MRLDLAEIVRCLGCARDVKVTDGSVTVTSVVTDSREAVAGSLFVCIAGERVDGHDYAARAVEQGAVAVLASRPLEGLSVPVLLVQDTVRALGAVAALWRGKSSARVVGITGSAGKTTVKELLAHVLSRRGKTACNALNLNNQVGMPLCMLKTDGDEDFWVFEAGISHEGDMDELGAILQPDLALILNVGAAHTEGLGERGVAWHKSRLLAHLAPEGQALVSADYDDLVREARAVFGDVLFFTASGRPLSYRAAYAGCSDGVHGQYRLWLDGRPCDVIAPFRGDYGTENCIAVAPGANHSLTCEAIDAVADRIAGAEYLLVQLEIPMETVACAIEKAYAAGTRVVLNPAPAMPLVDELLRKVYLITPNRTESETLTGIPVHTVQDASKAAGALLAKGVGNVIVTLGSEGALIRTPAEELLIPARTVTPVDTTAAGDVFNGALLVALSEGRSLADAVRFAAHSASVSVTRMGAQASIPWRGELETLA